MPLSYEIGSGAGPGLVFGATFAEGLSNAVLIYLDARDNKRKAKQEAEQEAWKKEMELAKFQLQTLQHEAQVKNNEMLAEIRKIHEQTLRMGAEEKTRQTELARDKFNLEKEQLELTRQKTLADIEAARAKRRASEAEEGYYAGLGKERGVSPKVARNLESWEARDKYNEQRQAQKFDMIKDAALTVDSEIEALKRNTVLPKNERKTRIRELEQVGVDLEIAYDKLKENPGAKVYIPQLPSYVLPKKLKLSPRTAKKFDYAGQSNKFAFRSSPPAVSINREPPIYSAMREKVGYNY